MMSNYPAKEDELRAKSYNPCTTTSSKVILPITIPYIKDRSHILLLRLRELKQIN